MDPLISTVLSADDSWLETEQRFLWYCVISTAQDCAEGRKMLLFILTSYSSWLEWHSLLLLAHAHLWCFFYKSLHLSKIISGYCHCPCHDSLSCYTKASCKRVARQVAVVLTVPKQFQQLAVLGGVGVNLPKLPSCTASQELHKPCIFLVIATVGGRGISSVVSSAVWKVMLSPLKSKQIGQANSP